MKKRNRRYINSLGLLLGVTAILGFLATGCANRPAAKETDKPVTLQEPAVVIKTPAEELKDLLNQGITQELRVAIQYMWQHIIFNDLENLEIQEKLRAIAIKEMGHAKAIAERLDDLGGTPTTKMGEAAVGANLKEAFENDRKAEAETLKLYTRIIELAGQQGDEITVKLFRKILQDEQDHYDTFSAFLEKVK